MYSSIKQEFVGIYVTFVDRAEVKKSFKKTYVCFVNRMVIKI